MPTPESCRFTKSHEWISPAGPSATVGVSDHAQHEMTDVVFVEVPKQGRKVKAGEACAVVESVKAAFDIYAPVSGEVLEGNAALAQDPSLVNQSPHDKGWLFRLKPSDPKELEGLMNHAQYEDFLKAAAK